MPSQSDFAEGPIRMGVVVGCAEPPAGSLVTAMAARESGASAYVARTIAEPEGVGVKVPALTFFWSRVTSHSWYVWPGVVAGRLWATKVHRLVG